VTHTRIRVTGTVQGVGFRPFVYRHAVALGLVGSVRNDSEGVLIDVEGDPAGIAELHRRLLDEPPPLARIAGLVAQEAEPSSGPVEGFRIVETDGGGPPNVPVSVDTATCAACMAEVGDPADRRYRYAFTNCTDCGPRYTIVTSVPYDRPATTMAGFRMCAACQAEYDDPADRRFHAQPNACPVCGPALAWRRPDGELVATGADALDAAVDALRRGRILAVKGVGGFHLAVDATDDGAVAELRRRKHRDDKPFAVLVADLAAAAELAVLDEVATAALASARRPVVLVPRRPGAPVADLVAPGLSELGLLLPYSPAHHLLVAGVGRPLVLTSGNLSDEPIAHTDDDAAERLGPLVDGILGHDRPIHIRCDDSVARAAGGRLQLLRRSRGYAPEPLVLPVPAAPAVLALGAELKSTIAVAKGAMVVASHHIGDLEHLATYRSFRQAIDHLCRVYGVAPEVVACDLHPEYLSSKLAADLDLPVVAVQHHHAHVAACLVEHGRTAPVVALAFDGLGYGPDGTLWGGEVLVADLQGFERAAHLLAVPMPGGVAAIREPWRMAAVWAGSSAVDGVDPGTLRAVLDLAERPTAPVTTSVGRLFDAVAALLGGRHRVSYEGQAAIELEARARTVARRDAPTYDGTVAIDGGVLDPTALVAALARDRDAGADPAVLAAGFHEALGRAAATLAARVARQREIDAVVLTGGVFQNARLTEVVESELLAAGVAVLVHEQVPPNDGGISIGQAAVAAAKLVTGGPNSAHR
jgi:hydrogenase maturation protein HypF